VTQPGERRDRRAANGSARVVWRALGARLRHLLWHRLLAGDLCCEPESRTERIEHRRSEPRDPGDAGAEHDLPLEDRVKDRSRQDDDRRDLDIYDWIVSGDVVTKSRQRRSTQNAQNPLSVLLRRLCEFRGFCVVRRVLQQAADPEGLRYQGRRIHAWLRCRIRLSVRNAAGPTTRLLKTQSDVRGESGGRAGGSSASTSQFARAMAG